MPELKGLSVFVETFGCQMNENDSERIAGLLAAAGARMTDRPEDSRVIIVNTCAVRGKSEEKLYSYLGRLRALKRRSGLIIILAGCVAQLRRDELLGRNPDVDFIVGPDNYGVLPELLAGRLGRRKVWTSRTRAWREEERGPCLRRSPVSAFITIMEGCDNFCAYCVVPLTRGREKCRPRGAILDEVAALASAGYKEIQFLGQNVNSYRDPDTGAGFEELLRKADEAAGIEWIRFITSHPKDLGAGLVEAMAGSRHVCREIHLPLQSGSTSVLARMKRGYTREGYLEKIRLLRAAMPDIALSTDIIVGFPGETETEFSETMTALEEIRFANIFSFRYSPRPRTSAARLANDVPLEVKRRRLMEAQAAQKAIQIEIHEQFIGRTIPVLCLGQSKKDGRIYSGRSEGHHVVNFRSDADVVGRFVRVQISACGPYSLRGEAASLL